MSGSEPVRKVVPVGYEPLRRAPVKATRSGHLRLIEDPGIAVFDTVELMVDLLLAREYVRIEQAPGNILIKAIVLMEPFYTVNLCFDMVVRPL